MMFAFVGRVDVTNGSGRGNTCIWG